MSTAALLTAPPRRHRPPVACANTPAAPLQITLRGTLLRDAEMRLTPGNRLATVIVLLAQAGRPPVRAVELFGADNASAQAAYSKAKTLRAGAEVELRGEGLRPMSLPQLGAVVQIAIVQQLRLTAAPFDAARAAANDRPEAS